MSLDHVEVVRVNYSLLDVLADVGGLSGALVAFIPAVLILLNYNYVETLMAT